MEKGDFSVESMKMTSDYLQVEDFENLFLPEVLPKYTGEGSTSYASKYDNEKINYLEEIEIGIPENILNEEGKVRERALFVTMFIVTGHILVSESIRRELGEDHEDLFREILKERNEQLEDARLDKYGYRRVLSDGSKVEDHFEKLGFSANPQKRVSREELGEITNYILGRLAKEKE